MRSTKNAMYLLPSLSGNVVEFLNDGNEAPVVTIEHIDTGASAAVSIMESNDGTTWTTVSGTTASISPGQSRTFVPTSAMRRLAVRGSGNVKVLVTVGKQVNGSPTDLGAA